MRKLTIWTRPVLQLVVHSGKSSLLLAFEVDEMRPDDSPLTCTSGANLAAALTHKAVEMDLPVQPMFQLLVVPVVDNLASTDGRPYPSWYENRNTPQLNHGRMLWFRDMYMPRQEDRSKWDASPMFAPEEWFAKVPDAWIGVAELDILRDEGIAYGEKLRKAGRKVDIKVYEKAPHPIMAMDGEVFLFVLQVCRTHR